MAKNTTSPITSHLSKLEPRFKDQNVPYGLKNAIRCFSVPTNHLGGGSKTKILKMLFFFGVFYDPDDPISTHMNDKWIPNSKSAHQSIFGPGDTKIRKMTYDVIKGH